jgi:hypothetical protein
VRYRDRSIGNQGWFEYGGHLGYRIAQGWVADLFVNGTLGPQPVGNTVHGGVGLRIIRAAFDLFELSPLSCPASCGASSTPRPLG